MPRSPEYDRSAVVEQAMTVFWERGYGKTSISDLVGATGLQPGSLYAAFGNKKGLFLEVIEQYNQQFIARIRDVREQPGAAIDKIGALLQQIVEEQANSHDHRGCLTVNAMLEMSQHDSEIGDHLAGLHAHGAHDLRRLLPRVARRIVEERIASGWIVDLSGIRA